MYIVSFLISFLNLNMKIDYISLEEEAISDRTPPYRLEELSLCSLQLAQLVASNSNTAPELLRNLASNKDYLIRQALVKNPNTPIDVLWKLGRDFPEELLNNPILSLLYVENPNLVEEIPVKTLYSILMLDNAPIYLLERAAAMQLPTLDDAFLINPETPTHILEKLAQKIYPITWFSREIKYIVMHPQVSAKILEKYVESSDVELRVYIATHPNTPHWVLERLATDKARVVSHFVAKNPHASEIALTFLSKSKDIKTRFAVALHPNTPIKVLENLVEDNSVNTGLYIPAAVAINSNTPPDLLSKLVTDTDKRVWQALAKRPHLSMEILEELATKKEACHYLIENLSITANQLVELAKNQNSQVMKMLAKHPNTPSHLLLELAKDNILSREVAENPNTPDTLLAYLSEIKDNGIRSHVAIHSNTPPLVLADLAKDDQINWLVAKNPNTPPEVLENLGTFGDNYTLLYLSKNPKIPKNILTNLAENEDYYIRIAVAENPNTSIDILEKLVQDNHKLVKKAVAKNPLIPIQLLEYFLSTEDDTVICGVAENINTPKYMLKELALKGGQVSEKAIRNPNMPIWIIYELMFCHNYQVRNDAERILNSLMRHRLRLYHLKSNGKMANS
jgi:hypothetical protein